MHEVNQPRLLPGCRIRLFTPGDGPGKEQSKTPKKLIFCTISNAYLHEYAL